jgi:hypothetical protein
MTREELLKWNKILHPEYPIKELQADWFAQLGIESAPRYPWACWSHIPECWGEEVTKLIKAIQDRFRGTEFLQVKEKFCSLVIYYHPIKLDDRDSIDGMIERCQDILRSKGLHP